MKLQSRLIYFCFINQCYLSAAARGCSEQELSEGCCGWELVAGSSPHPAWRSRGAAASAARLPRCLSLLQPLVSDG